MAKILLIEDEPDIIALYKLALEKEGFLVEIAINKEEGLKKIKELKIDLILLDIVLGKEEPINPEKMYAGFDILEKIKKDSKLKEIPVIIFTALGTKEIIEKGKKLGALDFFVKTDYHPFELAKKIKRILENL